MRKTFSRRHALVALGVIALMAITLAGVEATKRRGPGREANGAFTRERGETARQANASPVAVQETANLTATSGENANLSKEDYNVIVGTVLHNQCRLSSKGDEVLTKYKVRVDEVREGHLQLGGAITVTIRGGLVLLKEDGSEVQQGNKLKGKAKVIVENPKGRVSLKDVASTKFTPHEPGQLMENNKAYVLSIVKEGNEKEFRLASNPEGLDNF